MGNNAVKKITLTAMLIVIDIFLTAIPRYFEIGPLFSFNRITLGPATTIFSSLILGPLYGGIVGGVSDFLGWIIFPNSGSVINIFITLLYTILGVLPFYLNKALSKLRINTELFEILLILTIYSSFLILLMFTDLFNDSFISWNWDLNTSKIVILIIVSVLMILMIVILRRLNKKMGSSLINITIICTLTEIILMVFCKPFCFIAYANMFLGSSIYDAFGVSYTLLVLLSLMFSCIMIPLNSFYVFFLTRISKKLNKTK